MISVGQERNDLW